MGNGEFDHNSYRSPDSVNSMKWYMLDENGSEAEYIKELIAFRKAHPLLRMSAHEEVEDHSEVMPSSDGTIQLRLFDESEELLIFVNPIPRAKVFILPDGEWEMLVSDTMASENRWAFTARAYSSRRYRSWFLEKCVERKNIHGKPETENS